MKRSSLNFSFSFLIGSLFLTNLMMGCSGSNGVVNLHNNNPALGHNTDKNADKNPDKPAEGNKPVAPAPSPTPTKEKIARIICESQPKDAMTFNTLRSDVVSSYVMPSLTFYVNNQSVLRVKSPVPLQSDGEQAFLVLRAQEDNFTPWKIYKTNADLLTSRGDLQVISNYQGLNQKADYAYQAVKLENRLLTANVKRTAYVYPNDTGTYIWESLKGTKFAVPFTADNAFSPSFTGGDDYLRFDQTAVGGITLIQKFYNFDSQKTLSLPMPDDSKDFQLFGYINTAKSAVFWAEGRPDGVWKLRSMSLNSLGKASTLGILPGNARNIILPMVITESQGDLLVAYGEEELAQDQSNQLYLKTSVLHLVKASSELVKLTDIKTIEYPEEIKNTAKTQATLPQGVLRSLFFEPISGKLYASIVSQGGLASFDFEKNTWETHAMVANIFGCLNPEWGIETTHE